MSPLTESTDDILLVKKKNKGPEKDLLLLPGEKVAVRNRHVLNRKGRNLIRVRIFGAGSLGWIETSCLWGAVIEAVVTRSGNEIEHVCKQLNHPVLVVTPDRSLRLPPRDVKWDGLVLATVMTDAEADDLHMLIQQWQPLIIMSYFHTAVSTDKRRMCINTHTFEGSYTHKLKCNHNAFGGVTNSNWFIIVQYRSAEQSRLSINGMTSSLYPRPLQTALDDTVGPTRYKNFEIVNGDKNIAGMVTYYNNNQYKVYDANGLGPNLACLSTDEIDNLWVRTKSVFSKAPVVRRTKLLEVLAIWDYAGKIRYTGLSENTIRRLLTSRLLSPPAKIINAAAFDLFQQTMDYFIPESLPEPIPIPDDATVIPSPSGPPTLAQPIVGEMEGKVMQRVKAAMADDAAIDLDYWAMPGETAEQSQARVWLRNMAHRWWVYHLEKEVNDWIRHNGGHLADIEAAKDCIRRAAGSDYWDWHRGSRLFFWRFPEACGWRKDARDGVEFWHIAPPPKGRHFQNIPPSTREGELQIRAKVLTLKFRYYIEKGFNDLNVPTFPVEKPGDIRAVWDCKRNGLNATLWAPKFSMPTNSDTEDLVIKWLSLPVQNYLLAGSPLQDYSQDDSLFYKSFQFDSDVGQMFMNFTMHKKERHSHGVRFYHTKNDGSEEKQSFLRFNVLPFGCLMSPYLAIQGQERIMELCMGNPEDPNNPFSWHIAWLNIPFTDNYDPSMPRVMLLRYDGTLATRKVVFVDDVRGAGRAREPASIRKAHCHLASMMNYYGNQEAARKRRHVTLTPGAHNGIIIHTDTPHPKKSTTASKWRRGVSSLEWLLDQFGIPKSTQDPIRYVKSLSHWESKVDTAELRRIAGLWIHLTEVYTEGRCFLKGFYNAMEAFRDNRDLEGWRLAEAMDETRKLEELDAPRDVAGAGYPVSTPVTYELISHVHALSQLFTGEVPREVLIRPTDKSKIRYMVADASAEGFAAGVQYPSLVVEERDGLWDEDTSASTSNTREALNIANHLKYDISHGKHDGCELWCGTDNSVWSAVCNKGLSSVRHLFKLWVDINLLCYEHCVFLHCFHISGERMIKTGIDGLSRGDRDSGVTLGHDLRAFIPLEVSAFDHPDNDLKTWCKVWMGADFSDPLQPRDWFVKGQLPGVHIWAPPPGAALIALKEVARSRHKRPKHVTHVIMIPRLLYQEEWRSRFEKEVDIWFHMAPGDVWQYSSFEPLMIGFSFPLYSSYPWLLRCDRLKMVGIGRSLSKMSEGSHLQLGYYLRKLWSNPRTFCQV